MRWADDPRPWVFTAVRRKLARRVHTRVDPACLGKCRFRAISRIAVTRGSYRAFREFARPPDRPSPQVRGIIGFSIPRIWRSTTRVTSCDPRGFSGKTHGLPDSPRLGRPDRLKKENPLFRLSFRGFIGCLSTKLRIKTTELQRKPRIGGICASRGPIRGATMLRRLAEGKQRRLLRRPRSGCFRGFQRRFREFPDPHTFSHNLPKSAIFL